MGFYTDPIRIGIVYEPNNTVTVGTPPVAYGSPVPSTVSWEFLLDGVGTGVTAATYSIQESDVGKILSIRYTATDGTGSTDLVVTDVVGEIVAAGGSDWTDAFASGAFLGAWEAQPAGAPAANKFSTYKSGPQAEGVFASDELEFARASTTVLSHNYAKRADLYLGQPANERWTYVVGYVAGYGWQKAQLPSTNHWESMPQLTYPGADFNDANQVGGIELMCYALFLTDPGDVSVWTDFVSQEPAAGGDPSYEVSGNLTTYSSTRYQISNAVESGADVDWWERYGFGEFREEDSTTLRWMLDIQFSGNPYSNAQDFMAAMNLDSATLTVNGSEVATTSVTWGGTSSGHTEIDFNGVTADIWDTFSDGDPVSMSVTYSEV